MAPQIIWLGECFTVGVMNFSLYRAPEGLQTWYFRAENCFIEGLSENRTFFHISVSQSRCFFANSKRFFFIASIRRDFSAGMYDFRPKSIDNLRLIAFLLILIFFSAISACIFFSRAHVRLAHYLPDNTVIPATGNPWTTWSFAVLKSTFVLKFLMALRTAVLLTFICLDILRSESFIVLNWQFERVFERWLLVFCPVLGVKILYFLGLFTVKRLKY